MSDYINPDGFRLAYQNRRLHNTLRHLGCEHQANKQIDGNKVRCTRCGNVVGFLRLPK